MPRLRQCFMELICTDEKKTIDRGQNRPSVDLGARCTGNTIRGSSSQLDSGSVSRSYLELSRRTVGKTLQKTFSFQNWSLLSTKWNVVIGNLNAAGLEKERSRQAHYGDP